MFKILLLLSLIFIYFGNLFGQNAEPCKVSKNLGGKYKLVFGETSVVKEKKIFFLQIKLKPKNFTREYLLQTAQRIGETYCNENVIRAEILDSSDKRRFDDLTPAPAFSPATKAVYNLDKTAGKESIQLVSNDKVVDEIVIKN